MAKQLTLGQTYGEPFIAGQMKKQKRFTIDAYLDMGKMSNVLK